MRLGPALWECFTNNIEPDDFHLKHHIYTELAALPVREFNVKMREIMAGTKEGKKIIQGIVDEVKNGLKEDEFNEAMSEMSGGSEIKNEENSDDSNDSEGFDFDELMGGGAKPNSDGDSDDTDDTFNIEDLLN